MTKRRSKKTESPMYSKVDGPIIDHPHSAPIHLVDREVTEDTVLAVTEQLFELAGPDVFARWLASKLREKTPNRGLLEMVARMLDPKPDDYLKLVVERRRSGKTWTRRANDAALAKATTKYQRALGNKHGDQQKAIKKVAEQFGVSKATVLKALRSK